MLNFKLFFENFLFAENPSFMNMLLEFRRHNIMTQPVNIDEDDIKFLQQFPFKLWAEALYQRYNLLHTALINFYQRIVPMHDNLVSKIRNSITSGNLESLRGFVPDDEIMKLQRLSARRGALAGGQIPAMNQEQIEIESQKLTHDYLISQYRDDFIKELQSYPHIFTIKGADFDPETQQVKGGVKTKNIIKADPMLDTLYEKLDRQYGFDLAFPEGSKDTAMTHGLKFPTKIQMRETIQRFLNANYHQLFGKIDDTNAAWFKHTLVDERIKADQIKEITERLQKEHPEWSSERLKDEVESELRRKIQSNEYKGAPVPGIHPAGVPIKYEKTLGITVQPTADGVTVESVSDKKSKFEADDIIRQINGKDIRNLQDYQNVLKDLTANSEVPIIVTRDDKESSFKAKVIEDYSLPKIWLPFEKRLIHYQDRTEEKWVPRVKPAHYIARSEDPTDPREKLGYKGGYVKVDKYKRGSTTEAPGSLHLNRDQSERYHLTRGEEGYEEAWNRVFGEQEKCDVRIFTNRNGKKSIMVVDDPTGPYFKDIVLGIQFCVTQPCGGANEKQKEDAIDNIYLVHEHIKKVMLQNLGDEDLYESGGRKRFAKTELSNILQSGKGFKLKGSPEESETLGGYAGRRTRRKTGEFQPSEESPESAEQEPTTVVKRQRGQRQNITNLLQRLEDMKAKAASKPQAQEPVSEPGTIATIKDRIKSNLESLHTTMADKKKVAENLEKELTELLATDESLSANSKEIADNIVLGLNSNGTATEKQIIERFEKLLTGNNFDKLVDILKRIKDGYERVADDSEAKEDAASRMLPKQNEDSSAFVKALRNIDPDFYDQHICAAIQNYINSLFASSKTKRK